MSKIVVDKCPICNSNFDCDCNTSSLPKYFNLLNNVSKRLATAAINVSSLNPPSSISLTSANGMGLIDKLILQLPPCENYKLRHHFDENGIKSQFTFLNDRRKYIEIVFNESRYFYISTVLHIDDSIQQRTLISNPSQYNNFEEYKSDLTKVVPSDVLARAVITRLDVTVDYDVPFKKMLKCFELKHKRVQAEYNSKQGQTTGIRMGKGSEKIQIYDKQEESGIDKPKSRIEAQLKGSKLPTKNLNELKTALTVGKYFHSIELNEPFMINERYLDKSQKERQVKLNTLIDSCGLHMARKKLNHNDNFKRDYMGLYDLVPWQHQPDQLFNASMKVFFGLSSNV